MPPEDSRYPALALHLFAVAVACIGFESMFLRYGINFTDEGWPLYAAMQLHAGSALYREAFFVFPPGHLLPAWIGFALDPPGLILTRGIYAGFVVALCLSIYLLGRRLMPAGFALLGALLLAWSAPQSHTIHVLFGYRYLVWSVVALLCFDTGMRSERRAGLIGAGALVGVALFFRLTPAVAAAFGMGLGITWAAGSPRAWLRDALCLSGGFGLVVVPAALVLGLAADIGPSELWTEIVVRPLAMTSQQSLPLPDLSWPAHWTRHRISQAFTPVLFRIVALIYAGYAVWLARRGWIDHPRGRRSERTLLIATLAWGALFFVRSLGRSDGPHLESTLPPFCLFMAHALWLASSREKPGGGRTARLPRFAQAAAGAALLAAWVLVQSSDTQAMRAWSADTRLIIGGAETSVVEDSALLGLADLVHDLRSRSGAEDTLLDTTASPLLYVLSGRRGPGEKDVLMPGTFLNEAEEHAFLEKLRANPPALVVASARPFDGDPALMLRRLAPQLVDWLDENYWVQGTTPGLAILEPRNPRLRLPRRLQESEPPP